MKTKKLQTKGFIALSLLALTACAPAPVAESSVTPSSNPGETSISSEISAESSLNSTSENKSSSEPRYDSSSKTPASSSSSNKPSSSSSLSSSSSSSTGEDDFKYVTKAQLKDAMNEFFSLWYEDEYDYSDYFEWDDEYEEYYGYLYAGYEGDDVTDKELLEEFKEYCIPDNYTIDKDIYSNPYEDGSPSWQIDCYTNDGVYACIYTEIYTDEEIDYYYINIEVFPNYNAGYLLDDAEGGDGIPVTKAELLAAGNDLLAYIYDEPGDYSDKWEWDNDWCMYCAVLFAGDVADGNTLEGVINDFAYGYIPEEYTIDGEIYEFTWEEGDQGFEVDFYNDNGIYVYAGSYIDEGSVYILLQLTVDKYRGYYYDDEGEIGGDTEGTYTISFWNPWGEKTGADTGTLNTKLTSFINEKAGETIISGISNSGCQVMSVPDEVRGNFCCLVVGTGSAGGILEFSFPAVCKGVTITAETYSKTYNNNGSIGTSIDTNSKVKVNNTLFDLTVSGTTPKVDTKTFEINSNKLTLENDSGKQRVFIKTITFIF